MTRGHDSHPDDAAAGVFKRPSLRQRTTHDRSTDSRLLIDQGGRLTPVSELASDHGLGREMH